jgi:hypothetical protein
VAGREVRWAADRLLYDTAASAERGRGRSRCGELRIQNAGDLVVGRFRHCRWWASPFEGTFRQHMIVKGQNRDTAWYLMLDREWSARKEAFEESLDPANFSPDGRQRSLLGR